MYFSNLCLFFLDLLNNFQATATSRAVNKYNFKNMYALQNINAALSCCKARAFGPEGIGLDLKSPTVIPTSADVNINNYVT